MGGWSGVRGKGQAIAFLQALIGHSDEACVFWPFSHNGLGYGRVGYLGQVYYAHRLMCELAHGTAPADKPQAAHSCGNGNKGCVNPRHLSWKSNSENQIDRRVHGTLRPDRPVRLTVTPEQIEQMRALKGKMSLFKIADMLGVKRGVVEYWQKRDGAPIPLSDSHEASARRTRKRANYSDERSRD